jgi:N utilization substance protein B
MRLSRKHIRELLFLLLFRREFFSPDEMEEQEGLFFETLAALPESLLTSMKLTPETSDQLEEEREYISNKLSGILDHLPGLDETIARISEGWRLNRLGKVELAILRLAAYEIQMDPDIPTGVAINEAVVLTKRYSGEESARFVNGVLAKLA